MRFSSIAFLIALAAMATLGELRADPAPDRDSSEPHKFLSWTTVKRSLSSALRRFLSRYSRIKFNILSSFWTFTAHIRTPHLAASFNSRWQDKASHPMPISDARAGDKGDVAKAAPGNRSTVAALRRTAIENAISCEACIGLGRPLPEC
jgi:hypothetical protein